ITVPSNMVNSPGENRVRSPRVSKGVVSQVALPDGRASDTRDSYTDVAIASSKISSATSTFSLVKINGGDQRLEFGPQPSKINPRLNVSMSTRARSSGSVVLDVRSFTKSTPIMMPIPGTSPMQSYWLISSSRPG